MKLTKSQLNYILAIKQLTGGKTTQKYICEYLGVKKPSASNALKNLEETGYIKKEELTAGNNYILTEKAWATLNEIDKEKFEFLTLFQECMGIDEEICLNTYKNLCGSFETDFINKLAYIREKNYNLNHINNKKNNMYMGIEYGKYEVPFQVVQNSGNSRSMGDKGFYHPAILIVDKDKQYILLKSKEIYYKSKNDQVLKGKLQELYYFDTNLKWILSNQESESNWIIPLKEVLYQKDEFNKAIIGVIKIKVAATTIKMPESIAEITFNFKLIKKI